MDKKYITFYKKFILQTKTLSDGGVEQNRELKKILMNIFRLFFFLLIIALKKIGYFLSVIQSELNIDLLRSLF